MSEGSNRSTGRGRPRLPPAALERIRGAEKIAVKTLQESVQPYTPANPDFIYIPAAINSCCWKVIDHLATFAETMFDIQASAYAELYPELVREGDFLAHEIGPDVVNWAKLFWTRWEKSVDSSLRARWSPEYYRAYLQEGNRPDSEDEKLVRHFLARLDEVVVARIDNWHKQSAEQGRPALAPTAAHSSRMSSRRATSEPSSERENGAAPNPTVLSGSLSRRDEQVHTIIGAQAFRTLTNAEIMKTRGLGRRLREECELRTADAAKSCLDRIRKPVVTPYHET